MPKQLPYDEKYNEIIEALNNKEYIVVATTDGDNVAARTVCFSLFESSVYFITSRAYDKYKQICYNPNVALCADNLQIQGVAYIKGHPYSDENKSILEHYMAKSSNKEDMNRYVKHKNTVLIEVRMNRIKTWVGGGGREYLNLLEKSAFRIG